VLARLSSYWSKGLLEVGGCQPNIELRGSAQVVEMNKEQRRAAALEAEDLCLDETFAFEAWRDSLETVPTIKVGIPFQFVSCLHHSSIARVALHPVALDVQCSSGHLCSSVPGWSSFRTLVLADRACEALEEGI
jgi:hypothetical protein